jgi:ABC-type multidrug transport system fused ATPase/permease subunit
MDAFLSNLKSPGWWLTVVLVGILINLFAAYFSRWLDKSSGRLSKWWAERTQKRSDARATRIQSLKTDGEALALASHIETRLRIRSLIYMVQTLFFFFLYLESPATILGTVSAPLAIVVLFLGMRQHGQAARIASEIREAKPIVLASELEL